MDHKEQQALKALLARQVQQAHKASKVKQDRKDRRGLREIPARQDRLVPQEPLALQVPLQPSLLAQLLPVPLDRVQPLAIAAPAQLLFLISPSRVVTRELLALPDQPGQRGRKDHKVIQDRQDRQEPLEQQEPLAQLE